MKKNLVLFLLFSVIICAKAVEPINYGVIGGINVSSLTADGANDRIGFHIGAKAELPLPSNFFIESSLLFSLKGYKSDAFIDLNQNKVKITQENYYLELPIHVGYKLPVSDACSLLFTGGGYFGYGLFGTLKNEIAGESSSYKLYKESRADKRFDCGLGVKVGAEFIKTIQIAASYDWGLVNINKNSDNYKNRNIMFSCAYMF